MKYILNNFDVKLVNQIRDGSEYFFTFGIKYKSEPKESMLLRNIFVGGRHEAAILANNPNINFVNFCYTVCRENIIHEVERGLIDPKRNYNINNEEPSDFKILEFIKGHSIEINSTIAISNETWEDMKVYIIDRLTKEKRFITTSGELKNKFRIGLPFAEHDIFYNDLLRYCKEDKVNFSFKSFYRSENPQIIFDIEFSS